MNTEVTFGPIKRISLFVADRRRAAAGLPKKNFWRMNRQTLSDIVNLTPTREIMARKKVQIPFSERCIISLLSMIDSCYAKRDFRATMRRIFKAA